MNILFVTHYSSMYGANRSLLGLLDGIDSTKIKPHVILPANGDLVDELKKRNISYYIFPFKNWMSTSRYKAPLRFLMNLIALPFLRRKVKRWNIDFIHTNSSVTPIGAWLAFISGLTHIWHIREFGWEDYNLKYDFGRKQFEYWMNQAGHIITVSKSIKNSVLKNISTPCTVIYNGVISKTEAEVIKFKNSSQDDKQIIGIIGRLSPSKGQEQAINAYKIIHEKFPQSELWIAGTGIIEYENFLNSLSAEFKSNDKIKFLGYINKPFDFFSKIDIALVCSKSEGMGRVTAEAMIAGKIVIGLDNAGTSELIRDGETGFLYDGSTSSLVSKIEFALINDLSSMSHKARNYAHENFLQENYAFKVEQIICRYL